jgi:hypothetical protein
MYGFFSEFFVKFISSYAQYVHQSLICTRYVTLTVGIPYLPELKATFSLFLHWNFTFK